MFFSSHSYSKSFLCSFVNYFCEEVNIDDLYIKDNLYYKKFEPPYKLFTGLVSGTLKGKIVEGKKDGKWFEFNSDGIMISEKSYKKGKGEGKWIHYEPNGKIGRESFYKNGKLNGQSILNFQGGKVHIKSNYLNGKRDGIYTQYDENGKVVSEVFYKNGIKVLKQQK